MKKLSRVLALVMALCMVFSLAAFADEGGEPRVIKIGSMGAKFVGHFDATCATSTDVTGCQNIVYDYTFFIGPDGVYHSDILESYGFDEETLVYTMVLKDGIPFTSGDIACGEDILFSLQQTATVPRNAPNFAFIDFDASSVDGNTVNIQFTRPVATPQSNLATPLVNKSFIEENGGMEAVDFFDPAMVDTTGPYIPVDFVTGVSCTYEKNPNYWAADLYEGWMGFDVIETYQYSDETAMMVDFENGDIDMVISLSDTAARQVLNGELGELKKVSSNCVACLVFDVDGESAVNNIKVREAIAHAIDIEALGRLAYGELNSVPVSTLAQTNANCVPGHTYDYDVEYAKQCMEEAGVGDVTIKWQCPVGTPATIAEAMQAYLAEIGVTLDLQVSDPGTCIAVWQEEGGTDVTIDQNSNANSSGSAYQQYNRLGKDCNFTCTRQFDEHLNELLDTIGYTLDQDAINGAIAEMQDYVYDQVIEVPLSEWMLAMAYNPDVVSDCGLTDVYIPNLRYLA